MKEKKQLIKREINSYHVEFGLFSNLAYVIKAMKKHSKILLIMLPAGFFIYTLQRYLWSFVAKFIIDLIINDGTIQQLLTVVGISSLIILVLFLSQTTYYNKQWVQCIVVRMKLILEKNRLMMNMPFQNTEDPDILDCCQKAENAINGNQQGIEGMEHEIIKFFEQLGVVVIGLFILGSMNIWIIIGMSLLAVVNFIIQNAANKWCKINIWDQLSIWWRKRWYMNIALGDFSFAKDVRMYGLRSWLTNKFIELNKERYEYQRINNRVWFWAGIVNHVLWLIAQGGVYAYLIYRIYTKSLTIGNFSLYLSSAFTFFECVSSVLGTLRQMMQRSREVDDFRSFMENEKVLGRVTKGTESDTKGTDIKVPDCSSFEFQFQNVSFKYPRAENYALKNLNITVKAGERLAVVGLNGAGKSTFIKLLLRLYEPTEGKILLNGVDISTYELDSYFSLFAPVFQEVNLFAFSLAENVSMQDLENTNRLMVEKCVQDSGLDEKTNRLPKGIDTQLLKVIYDDGVDLSGGQKQKLALSRALYKNAPVVVLDEPTAALDAIAESKLYADFDRLIGGKTSIYISHRLSSTKFCNNVAMFKGGEMVEYGTHESLMAKDGEYANMFKIQAQYYVEDSDEE